MRLRTRATTIVLSGVLAALTTIGVGTASASTVPPRAHPAITDPAGDAKGPLGINNPDLDLLAADITTDGTTITVTTTTGHINSTGGAAYAIQFGLPPTQPIPALVSTISGTTATLISSANTDGGFSAQATAVPVYNSAAGTESATYPLAPFNAALATYGYPPITEATVLQGLTAYTRPTGGSIRDTTISVNVTLGG